MKHYLSAIVWALLVFTIGTAFGQVPKTLSYQGVLTDSSGNSLADGQYQMFLSIFEQSSGGVSSWDELQTVTVENGVFSAVLGSVTPFNLAFDKPYWLEIEVNGDVLSPRTELTASAYSLNTANIPDSIVSGAKIADGQVVRRINGLTDEINLAAGSNVSISQQGDSLVIAATGGSSGTGPWQLQGTDVYYSGGNVGIGTATPGVFSDAYRYLTLSASQSYVAGRMAALELQGSSNNFNVPFARIDFSSIFPTGISNNIARIHADGGGAGGGATKGELAFFTHDGTSLKEGLRIDQSGFVGIGTSSPTALVHSQSTGSIPSFLAAGSSADLAVPNNNQAMQFGSWDGSSFTEWMRISPAGYLGVGATDPKAVVQSTSSGNIPSFYAINSTADYAVPDIQAMQFGHWDGSSVFTERMRISTDGFVGINTTTPSDFLEVVGGIDITRTTNATALDIQHSGLLTNPLVNIETSAGPPIFTNLLEIKAGDLMAPDAQFIECARGTDVEFRVNGDGDVTADGAFTGGGADFAEMMEVSSGASSVEAGDVLVIDPNNPRAIVKSTQARSTLAAGIYSSKPGFVGSERDMDRPVGEKMGSYSREDMASVFNEIPMAVVGIVPCKVSAENGSIRPGDLLVTSSTPGHAMRDEDPRIGTVLGKALGSLSSGTGVIKVLVTLQ